MFGNKNKEEKAEQVAAGSAEVDRLTSLSVNDLAVEVMKAFSADGAKAKGKAGTPPMQIVQWLMSSYPYHPDLRPLVTAVLAGLQGLEQAGLVSLRTSGVGSGGQLYLLTDAGKLALADGSTSSHLPPAT
ncbi:MAG TPA: hypothetical protein VHU85_17950 [Acidimicrobiales bacterium]|jgi:hypothetical protein|nr:hypothetical protein [Acidimicrobiales bacterium]